MESQTLSHFDSHSEKLIPEGSYLDIPAALMCGAMTLLPKYILEDTVRAQGTTNLTSQMNTRLQKMGMNFFFE